MKAGQPQTATVLVVDDQKNMRATTAMLLRADGYKILEASSGEEALELLGQNSVDVLLTDLRMEPIDGITLLRRARQKQPSLEVIVMTAFGSIESAVEAMKLGAHDYISKPFREGELSLRVHKALEHQGLKNAVEHLTDDFSSRYGLSALVGQSPAIRELKARLPRAALSEATVLIVGESGTGKELVARAVHAMSKRSEGAFVPVNCAAITETLLESELFGHARGAFTGAVKPRAGLFEEASHGTIFIDEVSETSLAFQAKLLRVLQDSEIRRVGESTVVKVDARVVAASNRDLEAEVAEKRFRQDLYYRLNVVSLRVPPLRERLEEVPLLAEHFLARVNARTGQTRRISPEALEQLGKHTYPGNVRQLENLVEQAAAMAEDDVLGPDDFPLRPTRAGSLEVEGTLESVVDEAERRAILQELALNPHDLAQVARKLGVSSVTLWRKMKRHGIKAGAEPGV